VTYLFGLLSICAIFRASHLTCSSLFGGAHAWSGPTGVPQTQDAFATAAGGGLDVNVNKHISIKPIQVEYVMTQFDGSTKSFGNHQNDIRYSGGVVFKFGAH
jgi:hypothetical protein